MLLVDGRLMGLMSYREWKSPEESTSLSERARLSAIWRMRTATSQWRSLPDFVIIGGQRCGTTSLYGALSQHTHLLPGFRKEVHFFDLHYRRGPGWYRSNFPMRSTMRDRHSIEATPNYLAYPGAASRLSELLPEAKLVVLLRDPVERTYSSWKLRVDDGDESRPFEVAVENELSDTAPPRPDDDSIQNRSLAQTFRFAYVEKSMYADHLRSWLEFFDRSQILILQSERLFESPETSLTRIEDFFGIPKNPSIRLPHFNRTSTSSIDPVVRDRLRDHFTPQNDLLEQLTSQRFDWT